MIDIFRYSDIYSHIFVYKDCEAERSGVDVNCFRFLVSIQVLEKFREVFCELFGVAQECIFFNLVWSEKV